MSQRLIVQSLPADHSSAPLRPAGTRRRGKGDKSNLPGRPGGCFAQIGLIPFSARGVARSGRLLQRRGHGELLAGGGRRDRIDGHRPSIERAGYAVLDLIGHRERPGAAEGLSEERARIDQAPGVATGVVSQRLRAIARRFQHDFQIAFSPVRNVHVDHQRGDRFARTDVDVGSGRPRAALLMRIGNVQRSVGAGESVARGSGRNFDRRRNRVADPALGCQRAKIADQPGCVVDRPRGLIGKRRPVFDLRGGETARVVSQVDRSAGNANARLIRRANPNLDPIRFPFVQELSILRQRLRLSCRINIRRLADQAILKKSAPITSMSPSPSTSAANTLASGNCDSARQADRGPSHRQPERGSVGPTMLSRCCSSSRYRERQTPE